MRSVQGCCSLRKSLFTISTSTSWCAWRRIILQQCVRLPVRILAGLRCAAENEMPYSALLPLLSLTVSSNNPCQIACQSRHHIPKDCQTGSSGSCKCGPLAQILLLVAEWTLTSLTILTGGCVSAVQERTSLVQISLADIHSAIFFTLNGIWIFHYECNAFSHRGSMVYKALKRWLRFEVPYCQRENARLTRHLYTYIYIHNYTYIYIYTVHIHVYICILVYFTLSIDIRVYIYI
jgi:hypothetical protein